jgi:hypothetical protein
MSLGDDMSWADWVRLLASDLGLTLTDAEIDNIMWNETAWPIHTGLEVLRPQVLSALLDRVTGETRPSCPRCGYWPANKRCPRCLL